MESRIIIDLKVLLAGPDQVRDKYVMEADETENAKVIRSYDETSKSHIIHFTSVPAGLRARLDGLTKLYPNGA